MTVFAPSLPVCAQRDLPHGIENGKKDKLRDTDKLGAADYRDADRREVFDSP